ncbi:MAG: bifunctional ornithine acetyltransferase/N-acetylglutamate synthase [Clostridia bacterium]|nr:bifunctional ornithine acetyltransferase/N-acetylglutamate synthase [Clostridia bacterium]
MRKNGVNREIRPIEGGICAPKGFRANGVLCGVSIGNDLALIVADERYPIACIRSDNAFVTPCGNLLSQRSKDGKARAVFFNTGIANVCVTGGERFASETRLSLAREIGCEASDVLLFSAGEVCGSFPLDKIKEKITPLVCGLTDGESGNVAAKEGVCLGRAVSFAYAFELGDFSCKIGGIASVAPRLSGGVNASLVALTTDVNITPELLEKAFDSAYKDTFGLLGRRDSPFDGAVIFSSQKAGNCKISVADGEYKKFSDALFKVCEKIAKRLAVGEGERLIEFCVCGARSKQLSRALAKSLADCFAVKRDFKENPHLSELLSALGAARLPIEIKRAQIRLSSDSGELLIMEEGAALPYNLSQCKKILASSEIFVRIDFGQGNFSSCSWARV